MQCTSVNIKLKKCLREVFTEVEATKSSDVGELFVLVDKTASVAFTVKHCNQ